MSQFPSFLADLSLRLRRVLRDLARGLAVGREPPPWALKPVPVRIESDAERRLRAHPYRHDRDRGR